MFTRFTEDRPNNTVAKNNKDKDTRFFFLKLKIEE